MQQSPLRPSSPIDPLLAPGAASTTSLEAPLPEQLRLLRIQVGKQQITNQYLTIALNSALSRLEERPAGSGTSLGRNREDLEADIVRVNEEISGVIEKLEIMGSGAEDLRLENAELRQRLSSVEQQLQARREQLADQSEQCALHLQQINTLQETHSVYVQQLMDHQLSLHSQQQLMHELAHKTEAIEAISREMEKKDRLIEAMEGTVEQVVSRVEGLGKLAQELREQLEEQMRVAEGLTDRMRELDSRGDLEKLKAELEKQRQKQIISNNLYHNNTQHSSQHTPSTPASLQPHPLLLSNTALHAQVTQLNIRLLEHRSLIDSLNSILQAKQQYEHELKHAITNEWQTKVERERHYLVGEREAIGRSGQQQERERVSEQQYQERIAKLVVENQFHRRNIDKLHRQLYGVNPREHSHSHASLHKQQLDSLRTYIDQLLLKLDMTPRSPVSLPRRVQWVIERMLAQLAQLLTARDTQQTQHKQTVQEMGKYRVKVETLQYENAVLKGQMAKLAKKRDKHYQENRELSWGNSTKPTGMQLPKLNFDKQGQTSHIDRQHKLQLLRQFRDELQSMQKQLP